MDQLVFVGTINVFRQSIVIGVANSSGGSGNPVLGKTLVVDNADILRAVLLQLGAGAKKAPFLLCDQRYVPVLSGRLEYPANNHCIRIRVTIGKHRALPLPQ